MAYLSGFWMFVNYLVIALLLFGLMVSVYIRTTPYAEIRLIREGNSAAAVALFGAMIGLALPLASAVLHTAGLSEMAVWAFVAMAAQGIVYHLADRLVPELRVGIRQGNVAHGVFLAGMSVAVGLINAACVS